MANTSSRTLRLLALLENHRFWPGDELAGRLSVSRRTLRRDIERLRALGYPVDAQRGVAGGYQLAAGAVLPPLVLDDEEAVALGVGLQVAVQQGAIAGIGDSSVRALAKILHVMPAGLRRRVDALASMTVPATFDGNPSMVDPVALIVIAQACRDGEFVDFAYVSASGEPSRRHVEPHRLVLIGRRWYLVAYDAGRDDWRSFRLDRIEEVRNVGGAVGARTLPGEDAAAFVRAGIAHLASRVPVEAVVHAPATRVRALVGRWATIEEVDRVSCRLTMSADSLDWPAIALMMTDAPFEVVTPGELRAHLGSWGNRCLDASTPR